MSVFNIELQIDATGSHGCQRDIKDGQEVKLQCDDPNCPDCLTRRYFAELKKQGHMIERALFIHWPGQATQVTDNLITGIRTGSFY